MFYGLASGVPSSMAIRTTSSAYLNHPDGSLLVGGDFVHSLMIEYSVEYEVINLKCSIVDEPLVVTLQISLVFGDMKGGVPPLLIEEVDVIALDLILRGFVMGHELQGASSNL
jgi:hypothetical protein